MNKLFLVIPIMAMAISCRNSPKKQEVKINGMAQGTYYAITYFDPIGYQEQGRNFQPRIDSFFMAFDRSASVYLAESIISRFNNNDSSVVADENFAYVFQLAQKVSEATDGAFDITTMPLTNAWGFGFTNAENVDSVMIDSLLPFINYKNIELRAGRLIKKYPEIMIDYNAIAQGYSADLIGRMLESEGIQDYLIDVGGEVLGKGVKPNGDKWKVGIEKPATDANAERTLDVVVELRDKALATSGNYRRFFMKDGIRYSHTIDPITGYPVNHTLLSVSVLADDCITADAYATAFMVMGVEKSKEFLNMHPELEAHFIYSNTNGNNAVWTSEGLKKLMKEVE